mgnify:CR=1 FL=1
MDLSRRNAWNDAIDQQGATPSLYLTSYHQESGGEQVCPYATLSRCVLESVSFMLPVR